jgi:hypothetical protein
LRAFGDGTDRAVELLDCENSKPERLSVPRPIARSEDRAFFERPMGCAAARRSPKAIIDSLSGLDDRALQELDGEARSVAAAGVAGGGCPEMGGE